MSLGLAAMWLVAPATLLSQPWSGWGTNELKESARTFYLVHPLTFDPVSAFGIFGVLYFSTQKRYSVVCMTWLGLFCFLTCWGNFQSRYGLPLVPIQIILAVQVLREFLGGWDTPRWRRALVVGFVTVSVLRSLWLDWTLALSNDFFYF